MGLDFILTGQETEETCFCSKCGNEHTSVKQESLFMDGITHNMGTMAKEAKVYDCLWGNGYKKNIKARDLIISLREGLEKLKSDPDFYKKFNPQNGWGSYDVFVNFIQNCLQACEKYPWGNIYISI